jgi:hypothetical protein
MKHDIKNWRDHLRTTLLVLVPAAQGSAKNVEAGFVADPLLENGGRIGEGGRSRNQSL